MQYQFWLYQFWLCDTVSFDCTSPGRASASGYTGPFAGLPQAELVAQFGRLDARQAAVAELLSDMLKQPFFDELRTKQQLGYIVGSGLSAPQAVYALGFVVQSAVQPPAEVSRRILAFLASAPQILANASDEFPSYVAAAQTQLREPPKRLSQAADMLWPRVSEGTYRFGWPQKVARAMDDVTLADVLLHCKAPKDDEVLKPNGAGQILVREDMYVSHNIVSIVHAVNLALDTAEAAA